MNFVKKIFTLFKSNKRERLPTPFKEDQFDGGGIFLLMFFILYAIVLGLFCIYANEKLLVFTLCLLSGGYLYYLLHIKKTPS